MISPDFVRTATLAEVNVTQTQDELTRSITLRARKQFARSAGVRTGSPERWPFGILMRACLHFKIDPVLTPAGERAIAKFAPITIPAPTTQEKQLVTATATLFDPKAQVSSFEDTAFEDIWKAQSTESSNSSSLDTASIHKLVTEVAGAAAGAVFDARATDLEERVKSVAQKIVAHARPVVHFVKVGDSEPKRVGGQLHAAFERVLPLAQARRNVLLIGPSGSGKTHLAQQIAEALGLRFASVTCTAGMSEGNLTGRFLPTGEGGRFEYHRADFVDFYENGGVFLADEIDAADPNTTLVLNTALANGHWGVPNYKQLKRHPDFVMIGAANTFGTGANRIYVGRNQLDDAFLDRFRIGQVEMDYDRKLEESLVSNNAWLKRAWEIRDAVNRNSLRRVVSTRFILDADVMIANGFDGWNIDRAISALTAGWSADELSKVGLGREGAPATPSHLPHPTSCAYAADRKRARLSGHLLEDRALQRPCAHSGGPSHRMRRGSTARCE